MISAEDVDKHVATLQQQIRDTEEGLRDLKLQLQQAENQAQSARILRIAYGGGSPVERQDETLAALSHLTMPASNNPLRSSESWPLTGDEYKRYGRQLILPEIGLPGQLRLRAAKVLIVGAGGLGCPAAAYLAGAGVGTIGLVDGDTVEVSNLHRQIAHASTRVNMSKVDSAITYLRELNPTVQYVPFKSHLTPQDALDVVAPYDLVLDCTDHPTSRYLISDACILLGKPLVSASALRTDGQLMVLNHPPNPPGTPDGGPCYRCVFPRPPPAESVVSCGEGGILGPVVGTMGVLQALEAIKIITSDPSKQSPSAPSLMLFSAYSSPPFRSVRLRARRKDCVACSAQASITRDSLTSGSLDYVAFCGVTSPVSVLAEHERVTAKVFADSVHNAQDMALIDVRDATQFNLCSLPGSINIPWVDFGPTLQRATEEKPDWLSSDDVVVVCKLGNDSQLAARMIKDLGIVKGKVLDIKGGFRAWRDEVDPAWPDY